jgi:two-component system response regulator YesN
MYTVCIADDEVLIQKSITARLNISGTPVRVSGCADNAKGAISLYWDSKPDIFFVDINMPGMDGLSLIQRIREEDPACQTKFIIITGYDDFAHMREAIQSGVIDYLKKPISAEEFNKSVAQAARLVHQERNKIQRKQEGLILYDEFLSEPPQIIKDGTFIAAYSPDAETFINEEQKILDIWEDYSACSRIIFQGVDNLRLYYVPGQAILRRTILNQTNSLIQNKNMFFVYTYPQSEQLDIVIGRMEQSVNKRFIGYGIIECSPERISSALDTGILDYALEHGQVDTCRTALKTYFEEISKRELFYLELSPVYRQLVLLLINKYMAHKMPIPDPLKLEFSLFALCRYTSFKSLYTHLMGMTLSLAQKIEEKGKCGELIHKICEFLKQNYGKDICLNDLAGKFYVSSPYLSRRFREKTGLTLIEYLEDIRMDKAQEYLINSEAQIADISEQVGYMDPAYFAQVFKKKYNLSPSEYRQRNKT